MSTTSYPLCIKCGRPMRGRGVTRDQAPGTVASGYSGMCKSDAQPNTAERRNRGRKRLSVRPATTVPAEEQLDRAVAALQGWIARRHGRGVPPEESPIRYQRQAA